MIYNSKTINKMKDFILFNSNKYANQNLILKHYKNATPSYIIKQIWGGYFEYMYMIYTFL